MTETMTPPPEAAKALQIAESAYATALAVEIDSPEMFQTAGAELQAIKSRAKQIEELRLSLTRPLDESKRRIMDLFRQPLARLDEAEQLIRRGMLTFQQEERRKQEEARRAAEEAARAERERLAAEQREREEAARKAREEAEAAARAGDEAAAAAAREAAQHAAQEAEEAQAQVELAEVAPIALAIVEAPKAAGISTRQNWKAEVTDLQALVLAAAERAKAGDTTLLGYLQPDTKALGQVAKALKSKARIPGVRVYAEEGLAVRAA